MNTSVKNQSQIKVLQQKYNSARGNLMLMLILTVVNIVLLLVNSDRMFLFSATIPYFSVALGQIFSLEWESNSYLIFGITVAVIAIALYLFCWIFGKKNYGWLVAALVLFSVDTLCMAGLYVLAQDFSGIMDALIHIWVMYYLIAGVSAGYKLKKLPKEVLASSEQPVSVENAENSEQANESEQADTSKIRHADMAVKSRVLLETDANGKHICYRRVKRVNELVIDGYVYDEIEALVEPPHELVACVDGHTYCAGTNHNSRAYINVDGENVKSKMRII